MLVVDDGKDLKNNSQCNTTIVSGHEKIEVFKQALVCPEYITQKKTLGRSTKLPPHISSDEAIAEMEDKIKQKQIAEEKKKCKEEREMKWLQRQMEREEKSKKSSKRKGATKRTKLACLVDDACYEEEEKAKEVSTNKDVTKKTQSAGLSYDDAVQCFLCNNDNPHKKLGLL